MGWQNKSNDAQSKLATLTDQNNQLQNDITARDQELARLEQASSNDGLKQRLESLKEVVTHTLREKAELEDEVRELKERIASQQLRGSVIQDLQERLKMVKDMNQ